MRSGENKKKKACVWCLYGWCVHNIYISFLRLLLFCYSWCSHECRLSYYGISVYTANGRENGRRRLFNSIAVSVIFLFYSRDYSKESVIRTQSLLYTAFHLMELVEPIYYTTTYHTTTISPRFDFFLKKNISEGHTTLLHSAINFWKHGMEEYKNMEYVETWMLWQ